MDCRFFDGALHPMANVARSSLLGKHESLAFMPRVFGDDFRQPLLFGQPAVNRRQVESEPAASFAIVSDNLGTKQDRKSVV